VMAPALLYTNAVSDLMSRFLVRRSDTGIPADES
jgi:hypothetical protein